MKMTVYMENANTFVWYSYLNTYIRQIKHKHLLNHYSIIFNCCTNEKNSNSFKVLTLLNMDVNVQRALNVSLFYNNKSYIYIYIYLKVVRPLLYKFYAIWYEMLIFVRIKIIIIIFIIVIHIYIYIYIQFIYILYIHFIHI